MQPSPLGLSSENKRRNEPGLLQNPFPPSAATAGSTSILHGQHNPYDPNSGSGNQAHDTFHARPSPAFSQPSMMAMHMNTPHHFVGHASPSTLAAGPGPSTVMLPPIGVGSKAQNHDTDKVPRSESGDISVSLAADDNPSGMKKRIQSCDICRIRKVKCVRLDESKVSRCKQCEVNDVNCTYAYVPKKPGPQTSSAKAQARREEKERQMRAAAAADALGKGFAGKGKAPHRSGAERVIGPGDPSSGSSRPSSIFGQLSPTHFQQPSCDHSGEGFAPTTSTSVPAAHNHALANASLWAHAYHQGLPRPAAEPPSPLDVSNQHDPYVYSASNVPAAPGYPGMTGQQTLSQYNGGQLESMLFGRKSHPGSPHLTSLGPAVLGAPRAACLHSHPIHHATPLPPHQPPSLTNSRGSSPRPNPNPTHASTSAGASPSLPFRIDLGQTMTNAQHLPYQQVMSAPTSSSPSHFPIGSDLLTAPWPTQPSRQASFPAQGHIHAGSMPYSSTVAQATNVAYYPLENANVWTSAQQIGHHPSDDQWPDLWHFPSQQQQQHP